MNNKKKKENIFNIEKSSKNFIFKRIFYYSCKQINIYFSYFIILLIDIAYNYNLQLLELSLH